MQSLHIFIHIFFEPIALNTHHTYFIILGASLAGPLALSFDKKVGFYKKWKYVFPAMILPAIFYIVWDIYFTAKDAWYFNAEQVTGTNLFNLPIEEVLFFFVVPYCCLFIYECVKVYFPALKNKPAADIILKTLAVALIMVGLVFYSRMYTSWAFIFTGLFILIIYACKKKFRGLDRKSVV